MTRLLFPSHFHFGRVTYFPLLLTRPATPFPERKKKGGLSQQGSASGERPCSSACIFIRRASGKTLWARGEVHGRHG